MKFKLTLKGVRPLIVHNVRLADPMHPIVREMKTITGKRKKSDEDYATLAHLEFVGGLYHDPDLGPYLPGENVFQCIYEAAKKNRDGPRVLEALLIEDEINPLVYKGPRGVEELWSLENFRYVKATRVGTSRVIRTRPVFLDWAAEVEGTLDTAYWNFDAFKRTVADAGTLVGLCERRPRFGRFTVKVEK